MPKKVVRKINYRLRRKPYRRRRSARGRYLRKMTTKVFKTPLISDRIFVKLQYSEIVLISGAVTSEYVYRGNSVFDPNFTGVGAQPTGFDQWASLYENYRVHGSSPVMRVANLGTVATAITATPSVSSSGASTYLDTISTPFSRNRLIGPATGMGIGTVKNFMKTVKMVGEKIFNNDNYAAGVTGNPTSSWFWILGFFSMDGATNMNISVEIKITYYTEFFKRKQLDQS